MSRKLRVGVLAGGKSSERKISLRSGRAVNQALKSWGADSVLIDPNRKHDFSRKLRSVDVAFISLHGRGGEDGTIQRYLARKKVIYTGSAPRPCERSYDKVVSKRIFRANGIPTPDSVICSGKNWKTRLKRFPAPFFVKPPLEGSSIGAFMVEDFTRSAVKIRKALQRYGTLIIEDYIRGREFTVGIFGNEALPVVELRPKSKFYDYHAKYTKGMTQYIVPARIPRKWSEKLKRLALKAHRVLGLRDFSRIDFMMHPDGRAYVLEANSIPGFTELSLLPKAARAAGYPFPELCGRLVDWAWQRGRR